MSLDVLPSLVPVVEQTAQRAVGLLATGLHAVEAHQVGDVTPYADGLFHFSKHDVRFVVVLNENGQTLEPCSVCPPDA